MDAWSRLGGKYNLISMRTFWGGALPYIAWGCAAEHSVVFDLSVFNVVYIISKVRQQDIASMIDMICKMDFVCTPSIQKR